MPAAIATFPRDLARFKAEQSSTFKPVATKVEPIEYAPPPAAEAPDETTLQREMFDMEMETSPYSKPTPPACALAPAVPVTVQSVIAQESKLIELRKPPRPPQTERCWLLATVQPVMVQETRLALQ